jgi:hypothetical protein
MARLLSTAPGDRSGGIAEAATCFISAAWFGPGEREKADGFLSNNASGLFRNSEGFGAPKTGMKARPSREAAFPRLRRRFGAVTPSRPPN